MVGNIGGLLSVDPGQLYGNPNLQDPAVQQAIANRGLLAAVGSFGESAMPTRVPTPIGAVLGKAAGAAGAGEDAAIKARTDAMQGQLYGAQSQQALQTVAALKGMVDPTSPYYKMVQAWFNQGQGGQGPLMPNQSGAPGDTAGGPGVSSNPSGTLALLNSPLGDKIKYYANYHGLDPNVFAAMINTESSGNPQALNKSSGAAGLGQIIPSNFAKYGVKNPYDPDQNLDASAHLLADNLKAANGDMNLALKYYFAGQDQSKWGPNTAAYPGLVMSRVPPAQTAAAQAQQQQAANAPSSLITQGTRSAAARGEPESQPTQNARDVIAAGQQPPNAATTGPTFAPGVAPGGAPAPPPPPAAGGPGMLPGGSVPNMTAPGGFLGGLPAGAARTAAAGGGELGSPIGPAQAQIIAGLLGRQQAGAPARFAGPGAAEPAPAAPPAAAPPAAPAGAGGPGMLPGGAVPDITAPGGLLSGGGVPAAASPPPPAVPPPAAPGPPGAAPGTPASLLAPPPPPSIPPPPTAPAAVAPTGPGGTGGMSPETMRAGQALQLIGALTGHPEFGTMVTSSPQWQAAVEAAKAGATFPFQSALETQKGQQELVKTMYQGGIDLQKAGYEKQTEAVWGMIRDQMKPQEMKEGQVLWNPAMQSYMANYQARGPDGLMHHYFDTLPAAGSQTPSQHIDMGTSGEIITPTQKATFDANLARAGEQLKGYGEERTQALGTINTGDEIASLLQRGTTMGWGADTKTEGAMILQALGASPETIKTWTGADPTVAGGLNKLFLQLSSGAVRGMGAREPGSVISLFRSAYPQLESDPDAARLMNNAVRMQAQYQIDKSNGAEAYEAQQQQQAGPTGAGYKGLQNFEQTWNAAHSQDTYWRAAVAMSAYQQMNPKVRAMYQDMAWKGTTPEQRQQIVALMPKGQNRVYLGGDGKLYPVQ